MINVIWGSAREKPESSRALADKLSSIANLSGYLYLGYPIIGSPTGALKLDALLVSDKVGLIAFDLVEGTELGEFRSRQDDIASMLDVRLKPSKTLSLRNATETQDLCLRLHMLWVLGYIERKVWFSSSIKAIFGRMLVIPLKKESFAVERM